MEFQNSSRTGLNFLNKRLLLGDVKALKWDSSGKFFKDVGDVNREWSLAEKVCRTALARTTGVVGQFLAGLKT